MLDSRSSKDSWQDQIIEEFTTLSARLIVVSDPDGLLYEETLHKALQDHGFELIPIDDSIEFRFAYESKFRSRWDHGNSSERLVVQSSRSGLEGLPFDLIQEGRTFHFSLGQLFPNLSYPVLTSLDRSNLEKLYAAQSRNSPGPLGENATKDFVLHHVFEIAPELIHTEVDLLRTLLRRHYRNYPMPRTIEDRLIELLADREVFRSWPLKKIVPEREAFLTFLQERWPLFLDHSAQPPAEAVSEDLESYGLVLPGPAHLPFGHDDIRVYIDNLFVEGFLRPVSHPRGSSFSNSWEKIGIKHDSGKDDAQRIDRLFERANESLPEENANYGDWLRFAKIWAEIGLLITKADSNDVVQERFNELASLVDAVFTSWILTRFGSLINLPPVSPALLHHLPRFLAHKLHDDPEVRIALLVIDGLALSQWTIIRAALEKQEDQYLFRERSIFAWIPSVTSVSRQALFSGKAPVFFPSSIDTTGREEKLWQRFWEDEGFHSNEIFLEKAVDEAKLPALEELLTHPRVRVAGLVVNKVDYIMHGMELGAAGMHSQVALWAKQPFLGRLIETLLKRNFQVYLTSDHGNVEATGCGQPKEGVLAGTRSQRVRIFSEELLRKQVKEKSSQAIEWEPVGLPESYYPLIAPEREAFVREGKRIVSHGGISLEELVVPFVKIDRSDT